MVSKTIFSESVKCLFSFYIYFYFFFFGYPQIRYHFEAYSKTSVVELGNLAHGLHAQPTVSVTLWETNYTGKVC